MLQRMGFKLEVVKVGDEKCLVIVRDKNIKEPELQPVAIGGKPVE